MVRFRQSKRSLQLLVQRRRACGLEGTSQERLRARANHICDYQQSLREQGGRKRAGIKSNDQRQASAGSSHAHTKISRTQAGSRSRRRFRGGFESAVAAASLRCSSSFTISRVGSKEERRLKQ